MNEINTPARRFTVKGVNDDVDFCECCGKQNLKKVVWIEDAETGNVQHFGVVCASNPAKAFGLRKEIKQAVRKFEHLNESFHRHAHFHYKRLGGKYRAKDRFTYLPADQPLYDKLFREAKDDRAKHPERYE